MRIHKKGAYSIRKNGTAYYKVYHGRKLIASFLLLWQAEAYINAKISKKQEESSI